MSKRSLRADPNFDALISKIFPSRSEYDAQQERVLTQIKQSVSTPTVSEFAEDNIQQQLGTHHPRKVSRL